MSGGAAQGGLGATPSVSSAFSQYQFNEFAAQQQTVLVTPKFSMDAVRGIGGTYGPFSPNIPVPVPLWLALFFRETHTCTIRAPAVLTRPHLEAVLEADRGSDTFAPLPSYFFETAHLFTRYAAADVPEAAEVERLVQEIYAARQAKIRRHMGLFRDISMSAPGVQLQGLVLAEVGGLRAAMVHLLNAAHELESAGRAAVAAGVLNAGGASPQGRATTATTTSDAGGPGSGFRGSVGGADTASVTDDGRSTVLGAVAAGMLDGTDGAASVIAPQAATQDITEGATTAGEPQYKRRRVLRPR